MKIRILTCRRREFRVALLLAASVAGFGQSRESLDVTGKLQLHGKRAFGPVALLSSAASAGMHHISDSPEEWGHGSAGYGRRFGSTVARSGIRNGLAFGLDSTLHQDPRYFRLGAGSFWSRSGHALRGTILTRTDSGGETLSTWRIGSAYGAAFLSNQWYPDRLNTVGLGSSQGSTTLALDLVRNLASEFWPEIKKKVLRKK
jgi:hypothetical protein